MQELDVIFRVAGGTVLLMLAALLMRARRSPAILPWLFALLALGLCGFLARNTGYPDLTLSGFPATVAAALSGCAAAFLWWFCLAVFDDDARLGPLASSVGGVWIVVAMIDRGLLFPAYADIELSRVLVVIGVGMVVHLAWHLLRDREGDLVESRRRARWWLVMALTTLLMVDLCVDLAMGFGWKPPWFALVQNGVILAFAALMVCWLLRVDVDALGFRSDEGTTLHSAAVVEPAAALPAPLTPTPAVPTPAAGEPNARLLQRLDELIEVERVHRDPELTFADFAARMGAPEPAVRRLVNQTLGHRHFRSFLNSYRVADARAALADPARANEKMVAIAFDVGFSSLASFNRAFKDIEGRPPSEVRAAMHSPPP